MNQLDESVSQPVQAPMSEQALELQRSQAIRAELVRRMKKGANNFYWIAGLSIINSFILEFGGNSYFVVGLGSTLFVDSIFVEVAKSFPDGALIAKLVGLAISIFIAGIFALFGFFANRGKKWAFMVGMVLYGLDSLLMLVFQEWMGLLFHAFFLYALFGGLQVLNGLNKFVKPAPNDFPQNIGS